MKGSAYSIAGVSSGLGNQLIDPGEGVDQVHGEILCDERLGGILRYYHRQAA